MLEEPSRTFSLRIALYSLASSAFSPDASKKARLPISSAVSGVFVTRYWTIVLESK